MIFVITDRDDYIPLSEVLKASIETDRFRLHLISGEEQVVANWAWEDAVRYDVRTSITAQPGYALVEMLTDIEGNRTVHRQPVIGWAVMPGSATLPITASGIDTENRHALVPDGRVVRLDGWFDSLEKWEISERS